MPQLFTYSATYRFNQLLGDALTKPEIERRILRSDARLIEEYDLPIEVWQVISLIQASTLQDFCSQLVELETDF